MIFGRPFYDNSRILLGEDFMSGKHKKRHRFKLPEPSKNLVFKEPKKEWADDAKDDFIVKAKELCPEIFVEQALKQDIAIVDGKPQAVSDVLCNANVDEINHTPEDFHMCSCGHFKNMHYLNTFACCLCMCQKYDGNELLPS